MRTSRLTSTTLLILYVCAFTYLGALLGLTLTRAAQPIEFKNGQPPSSLSVGQIIAEAGLNGGKYQACKGDIFTLFQGQLDKKLTRVATELVSDALRAYKDQMASYLVCRAESFLNNLCVFGSCTGGGIDCKKPIASDVTSYLKLNWKDSLKSSFLASCTSLYALKFTGDTVDQNILENGPGGAPAYATNWIETANTASDKEGKRRFWTILSNTKICPYFKEEVYRYFEVPREYIETPPLMNASDMQVSADTPFTLVGGCTLPTQEFDTGSYEFLSKLIEPQNNFNGFVRLAEEEQKKQREAAVSAAKEQLIAGGGFLPTYASGSCNEDPNGKCISYDGIALPPGAVRDSRMADITANYNKMLQSNGENYVGMTDLGARLQVRILGLMNKPLPLKLELGSEFDEANFTPIATPVTGTNPNDPTCTGGNAQCTCVKDNPDAQRIASSVLAPAIERARSKHPEFFVTGSSQIAPGVDYRLVLAAICSDFSSVCTPHPSQDDEIVIISADGLTISYDVITGDGYARTDGGAPVAQCESGVQN
ncbi:MAG: hypothetical protein KBC02_01745 [Candidatus Pacebacteria bacterium]|nr:hypothetical protein [Candidatus Paceibacterota bacterium]